jgi:hypothetical protein
VTGIDGVGPFQNFADFAFLADHFRVFVDVKKTLTSQPNRSIRVVDYMPGSFRHEAILQLTANTSARKWTFSPCPSPLKDCIHQA